MTQAYTQTQCQTEARVIMRTPSMSTLEEVVHVV